ncbi:TPA: hypothetical protein ACGAD2_002199 [Salmonella enterica subsp. enterica serovar Newport]
MLKGEWRYDRNGILHHNSFRCGAFLSLHPVFSGWAYSWGRVIMEGIIFSAEMITVPGLGTYPAFTALLLLYCFAVLFGLGTGYALSITKVLFSMAFKR